jgi:uncharacterized protein YkwD
MTAVTRTLTAALFLIAAAAEPPAGLAEKVVAETNALRAEAKAEALKSNDMLGKVAQSFAEYLAKTGKFAHDADGKQPWDRTDAAGYPRLKIAENILMTGSDESDAGRLAKYLVSTWNDSEGHRANMLDPDLKEIGVGAARAADGSLYAVQVFGSRRPGKPAP